MNLVITLFVVLYLLAIVACGLVVYIDAGNARSMAGRTALSMMTFTIGLLLRPNPSVGVLEGAVRVILTFGLWLGAIALVVLPESAMATVRAAGKAAAIIAFILIMLSLLSDTERGMLIFCVVLLVVIVLARVFRNR